MGYAIPKLSEKSKMDMEVNSLTKWENVYVTKLIIIYPESCI